MACVPEELNVQLYVLTPIGSLYHANLLMWNYSITIQNRLFFADPVILGIHRYDVISEMDWLTKYRATIDCKQKTLVLITTEGENLMYKGGNSNHTVPLISATKACKLVEKGCNAYLCTVEAIETPGLEPKVIPVV